MRQEVNLYTTEFVPKIKWCSFVHAALISVLFLFFITYYSLTIMNDFTVAKNENTVLSNKSKEFDAPDSSVGLMDLIVEKRESLERQVGNLSKEVESKKAIKGVYETEQNVRLASFHDVFFSIAQESRPDFSVSEIGIYNGGQEVIVNGLSRTKNAVPDYFKRLKSQDSFAMVNFGLLKIIYMDNSGLYEFLMIRVNENKNELTPILNNDSENDIDNPLVSRKGYVAQ